MIAFQLLFCLWCLELLLFAVTYAAQRRAVR